MGQIGQLNFDDVVIMWDICRFQKAWHFDQVSPFCAAFAEDDLKVCMFHADIEYYCESLDMVDVDGNVLSTSTIYGHGLGMVAVMFIVSLRSEMEGEGLP